jgi:hypothetical protein
MNNLEEKFKVLTCKNNGKSQVNSMEKKSMKQNDSSFEFNVTNAKEVITIHLVEMNAIFAIEEAQHK